MDAAQLRPSDETFRILTALIESSDDAILAKDLQGTILSWNRGAERIYGYSAHEIVGKGSSKCSPRESPLGCRPGAR